MARKDGNEILNGLTEAFSAARGPQTPVTAGSPKTAIGGPPDPSRPQPPARLPASGAGTTGPQAGRPRFLPRTGNTGFPGPMTGQITPRSIPPLQQGRNTGFPGPMSGQITPPEVTTPGRPGTTLKQTPQQQPSMTPVTDPLSPRRSVEGAKQTLNQAVPRINPALGSISTGADGKPSVVLNEAGRQAYQRMKQDHLRRFGKWPGNDNPASPQPNVIPGEPSFNPFAPGDSAWVEG